MKNFYLSLICLAFTAVMHAQNVGINSTGATPEPSAGLDVDFTNKGVLIPRVSLSSLTTYNPPITGGSPTTSMLVYNTNNTIGEGYYYWDGSRWVKIITSGNNSSDAWLTTGNAGTTPANNFLGTTDNQALVFRTNNTEKMRITSNGNVGIGTTTPGIDVAMTGGLTINGTAGTQFTIQKDAVTGFALNVSEFTTGDVHLFDRVGGTWNRAITLRSGKVGIGTTDPNSQLTVVGNALFGGNDPGSPGAVQITIGGTHPILNRLTYGTNGSGYKFAIGKNQAGTVTDQLIIQENGNVGIGTTIPGTDVAMTGGLTINGTAGTQFTIQKDAVTGFALNVSEFTTGDVHLFDRVGGTWNRAITLRSGNVGIGTTNPSNHLDIAATSDPLRLGGLQTDNTLSEILVADANGVVRRRSAGSLVDSTAWSLLGNGGTDPSTNFLGTTDAQPLVIRVNNQETFRFNAPGAAGPAWSIHRGGGNPRGFHAVDLQSSRSQTTQVASGNYSVISGGRNNTASGHYSSVGGGFSNTASGHYSFVGGGSSHTASGSYSFVGGGWQNSASGYESSVGGGESNTASGSYSSVGGGQNNTASNFGSFVGGGYQNTASGQYSSVGGGQENTASGQYSSVGGGRQNSTSGSFYSFVGGGQDNTASGQHSSVGGGQNNTASGSYSFVGGGRQNSASGSYSAVIGGFQNTASAFYSTVIGGFSNTANAEYVMVFGNDVDPTATDAYRVYLFSPANPGRLVLNRLQGGHPIHVGTNNTNGNGAHLTAGGQWMNASTRTKKDRFVQLNRNEVLAKIRQLPVEGWFYKGSQEYHIGPYAEDFHDAFGTGVLDGPDARTSLAASDVAGVALVGVQALAERVNLMEQSSSSSQTESRLQQLEQENAQLQQRLEQLERLVEQFARGNNNTGGEQPRLGEARPNSHHGTTTISSLLPLGGASRK